MSDITLSKAVRTNLLSLQNTADLMSKTQERLATGKKVNSALDNPTNFFTASSLNSRAGDLNALMDSMSNGIKTLEAASNGFTAMTKALESMQSTLRQARQDKSFQTAYFDVNANSVLTVDGGQFELPTEIKLGEQAPGIKAELKTQALTAYLGPDVSTVGSETGIGARTLITNDAPGLVDGSVITVAGMTVTLDDGGDAVLSNAELATQINDVINAIGSPQANKYTVSVGGAGSPNDGKIIIETIDPTAPAANVQMGAGTTPAVLASTSFNYSAITSSVEAGGEEIATGSRFEEFVFNLMAASEAGGYTVEYDLDSEDITLTATTHGAPPPTVTGVPANVAYDAGTPSTTTFEIANAAVAGIADTTQTLTIAGYGTVSLTSGMNLAAVQGAFAANTALTDDFTVNVAADLTVTLTARTNTGTANPAVTSDKGAAAPVASTSGVPGGGYNFAGNLATNVAGSPADGLSVQLEGMGAPFVFGTGPTIGDDMTALRAAAGTGYTITENANGLVFERPDGKAFTIDFSGGAAGSLGLGGMTTVNVPAGTEVGIVGGNAGVAQVTGDAEIPAVSGQTSVVASAGVSLETVEAERDALTITYDGRNVDITVGGIKGGIGSTYNALDIQNWQNATVARINAELTAGGITGLEATFDDTGRFSIIARTAEAKSIAISGDDGVALFGTDNVKTGTPAVHGYSSNRPIDQWVEEINRNHGDKLRASNDNGRLRIENFSTRDLGVSFDADGPGVGTGIPTTIKGNSVRENLALQYNELRDQLDKLADDASFNGINLLRGDNLKINFNENGNSFIDIQTKDGAGINSSTLDLTNLLGVDLDSDDDIDALIADVKIALTSVRSQASKFGSNLSIVQNRQEFTKQMINTLETGAANLTLADMNEEAANLLALQTRQSLSSSSLSLASQADQSVLQLLQ